MSALAARLAVSLWDGLSTIGNVLLIRPVHAQPSSLEASRLCSSGAWRQTAQTLAARPLACCARPAERWRSTICRFVIVIFAICCGYYHYFCYLLRLLPLVLLFTVVVIISFAIYCGYYYYFCYLLRLLLLFLLFTAVIIISFAIYCDSYY